MTLRQTLLLLTAAASFGSVSCAPSGNALQGCGGTFPAPLYKRWFLEFYRLPPNVRTSYQAIGSGAGVRQFSEGLVNFGASDESLSRRKLEQVEKELAERNGGQPVGVLQLPMTAGSVALCYNLPGNPEVRLSRRAYLGVLLGEVLYWDDEAIARDNPGVDLPHAPLTFVRRAEGSGTTYVFTSHVVAVAGALKVKTPSWLVAGKSLDWPAEMIGGKGNNGVAALIQQTPGALGYVETGYAELTHLPMAVLQNRAGAFVGPTAENSRRALLEAHLDEDLRAAVHDPKGKDAYPIVTFTWVLVRKRYADEQVAQNLKALLRFCLTEGQQYSSDLGYIPLPEGIARKGLAVIEQIRP
jgi:phosphate transport system substrate-binding protein